MTLEAFRVHLTPLSPVHVGCGESFEPTNYVIEDGWLHAFDTGAAIDALTPADRKALLELGNRKPDVTMLLDVQRFFHDRREVLAAFSTLQVPVLDAIAALHASRVGNVAQREERGRDIINQLAIDRTSFDPVSARPVLFGSSVKGAIRTAILNDVNGERAAQERKGLHEFQGRVLNYLNDRQRPEIELDPLRLLHVSDMHAVADAAPYSQVWYAVDRKKSEVRDAQGKLRRSQAEAKDLYQILECLRPWQHRGYTGQLTIRHVDRQPDERRGRRLLPDANLRPSIGSIARACNAFYRRRFDDEIEILSGRGYVDGQWLGAVKRLLEQAQPQMTAGRLMLLRVGRHSGAESVTLDGVRSIKILEGKDPVTGRQRSSDSNAAKTVWLAARTKDQQADLLPFGWMLAEIEPLDAQPAPLAALVEACRTRGAEALELAASLAARSQALRAKRVQVEDERRAQAEAAARSAAEKAEAERMEAEKARRRDAMTEPQKAVEDFVDAMRQRAEQLRGKKDRPNTDLHQRAQKLAKQASEGGDWTAEDRRAAADAIQEWLPKVVALPDVRAAFRKLGLAALRGGS